MIKSLLLRFEMPSKLTLFPRRLVCAAAVVAPIAFIPCHAADPQAYKLNFAATGNSELDSAISGTSQLESLRGKGPVAPFVLIGRARQDMGRLEVALRAYGYYDGKVSITIAGHALDDPDLVDEISAVPARDTVDVQVGLDVGSLYRLRRITIEGDVPDDVRGSLGIAPGDVAVASKVLNAQSRLRSALAEDGYPLATVEPPAATADLRDPVLDVTLLAHAGPRADIGEIRLTGLDRVNEDFVRSRLLVHPGERFSPNRIEKTRMDLLGLGVFSGVTVRNVEVLDGQGRIPLIFELQERPRHGIGLGAAYSTDLGGSAKVTWSQRNLLGNAEQLNLAAAATGLGGTASGGLGYNVTAQFIKPEFLHRDQSLGLNVAAINQKLEAYAQNALMSGVSLNRKVSTLWSAGVGLSAVRERIVQEGSTRDYTLLGLPVSGQFNNTGVSSPLDDSVHGVRATLTVTPTESFGPNNANFVVLQANASTYFDLASLGWTPAGRSVIALRMLMGSAIGAAPFSLPPDQRFYSGGSTTVRGFRFQSIGPQFADQKPAGGTSIDAGTIEWRQRFLESLGVAAFVDAGQVGTTGVPLQSKVFVGAGLGMRYYTAIGAIRVDVAVPANKQPGSDTFEVYVGLGQAF
jgi:translocation and assembly module TamA